MLSSTVSPTTPPAASVYPSGYSAGTFLLYQLASREDSPTPVHGVTTGGVSWTQIGSTEFLDIGTTGIALSLWYRFAESASESDPTLSCPTPNVLMATMHGFDGVNHGNPLDAASIGGTAAAATTLQPNGGTGITTVTPDALVIACVSTADDNSLTLSTANGFSLLTGGLSYSTTSGGDGSEGCAYLTKSTPGNQTAPTFNQSANGSDAWAWMLIALKADDGNARPFSMRDRGSFISATSF